MKLLTTLIFSLFFFISCTKKETSIVGKWNVISPFYKATYEISNRERTFYGKALYYNDGTTQYTIADGDPGYFFTDLVTEDGKTYHKKKTSNTHKRHTPSIIIDQIHQDTLKVTSMVMHQPLTEKWVRTK